MGKRSLRHISYDALMRYAQLLGTHKIHTLNDRDTGLFAVVAIHNVDRGSAIGGCRFFPYQSTALALKDVLSLSYGMTLKASISELHHGGAKAVIIQPPVIKDREAMFQAYGDFVHSLGGDYITAMDMGTTTHDMEVIAKRTPHVIGSTNVDVHESDPSPFTARGVYNGIRAAVAFKLQRDSVDGLRVSIQGLGKVGMSLCRFLVENGAVVTACEQNEDTARMAEKELGITIVDNEAIYDVSSDVFAPCAIGGVINADTISRLDAKIIAGAANNQMAHKGYRHLLHQKGVLYAPDFAINAGGLIQAACLHDYGDLEYANLLIDRIYDRMLNLFERGAQEGRPTFDVAETIAKENVINHKPAVVEEVV